MALEHASHRRPLVGWVGLGLVTGALTVGTVATVVLFEPRLDQERYWRVASPMIWLVAPALGFPGLVCVLHQAVLNSRHRRQLDEDVLDQLRRPPVRVALVPVVGQSPGVALVGRF